MSIELGLNTQNDSRLTEGIRFARNELQKEGFETEGKSSEWIQLAFVINKLFQRTHQHMIDTDTSFDKEQLQNVSLKQKIQIIEKASNELQSVNKVMINFLFLFSVHQKEHSLIDFLADLNEIIFYGICNSIQD